MRENQAGFRSGRGCVDQIFTLRLLLSKRYEFHQPSIVTFVDFKSAFDSISRDSLWNIMFNKGIPQKLINIFKGIYRKTSAMVHVYNDHSEPFNIFSGVRQGAIASPVLFNFIIDWVMEMAVSHCYNHNISIGFPVSQNHITDLAYADDIALLSHDESSMQFFLDSVIFFGSQVGLAVNPSKCKVLYSSIACPNISVNGNVLENVDSFCYLGSMIASDGSSDNDINIRIGKASSVFNSLKNCLFSRSDISLSLKFRVYCASVRSVLLYGSESWPLNRANLSRCQSFELRCLRNILHIRWDDFICNDSIYDMFHQSLHLKDIIHQKQLIWFGHVLRMNDNRFPRSALFFSKLPHWRRPSGGLRHSWKHHIHKLCTPLTDHVRFFLGSHRDWLVDGSVWLSYLHDLASNRQQWKACVSDMISSSHGTS